MGFIDKALEKAKAEKQKSQGAGAAGTTAPPPKVAPAMPPPPPTGAETAPEAIAYTATRTMPVSQEELRRRRIITVIDDNLVREEYKILRTQILQRTREQQKNTLMITGPSPNEGKTLTAINLAISLSHEVDKTVLLVDADLRFPSVHSYFGIPSSPGLVDYLSGNVALSDLLVHPQGFDKLVILPGGRAVAGAAELISSPMMGNLVRELKHFYPDRYVIFDLPPVLSYTDPLAFAPFVDAIILVVEMGKTPKEDIQRTVDLFKDLPVLGIVLNKADQRDHDCHYYYSHQGVKKTGAKKGLLSWIKF